MCIEPNPEPTLQTAMSEAERQRVLVEFNSTRVDYPRDVCLHRLFEVQVSRTPDAVALVFEGEQLTYSELDLRANQLAHCLQALGVCPDVLVGVYMERSIEMVVALYGIRFGVCAVVAFFLEFLALSRHERRWE